MVAFNFGRRYFGRRYLWSSLANDLCVDILHYKRIDIYRSGAA